MFRRSDQNPIFNDPAVVVAAGVQILSYTIGLITNLSLAPLALAYARNLHLVTWGGRLEAKRLGARRKPSPSP
jgi:hypothetical protein